MIVDPYRFAAAPVASSTWNPADKSASITLTNSDLTATHLTGGGMVRGVQGHSSGDYYFEIFSTNVVVLGIAKSTAALTFPGSDADGWGYYANDGHLYNSGSDLGAYGASWGNDTIGIRLNGGVLTFYKNGVSQGTAASGLSGTWYPAWGSGTGGTLTVIGTIETGSAVVYLPSGSAVWG